MRVITITTMSKDTVTKKIKIWGIVQGVGFRPFTARLADRFHMKGQIRNMGGLVEIYLTDTEERISAFLQALTNEKPAPAEIVHMQVTDCRSLSFDGFSIVESSRGGREAAMIPADIAVCPECLREMRDPHDRRYKHPFISCMICGPRYTITDRFPYDRENTSMIDFPMCDECRGEYEEQSERRFHAQTISCNDCGPYLMMKVRGNGGLKDLEEKGPGGSTAQNGAVLEKAAEILKKSGVIAFKSMGGYNLMADPLDPEAVRKLRIIKGRESKPFAVMFSSTEEIRKYCSMDDVEEKLVTSSARPIMLLERTISGYEELDRSRFIGSFLPSMGAQYMLLEKTEGPLISTSANLSSMPMITDDDEMMKMAEGQKLIDAVVYNTRKIRIGADDSVVRAIDGQPQMIRRSKGYAPVPMILPSAGDEMIFASGGQLKNSFALTKGPFIYMSQYFGDMDSEQVRDIYRKNVTRMEKLFRIKPALAVCDMHPAYFTSGFAEEYAEKNDIELIKIQHHHAHVASVMAEHDIEGPVIGVSFDGTGYGTDGAVWGGEFLICEGGKFERDSHLKYVTMTGGDSTVREGWKSAISYIHAWENGHGEKSSENEIIIDISDIIKFAEENRTLEKFSAAGKTMKRAIDMGINTIESSSMGRLFDGVAAALGICSENTYEGQCAIMLEDAAARADAGRPQSRADELALGFHRQISRMILDRCLMIKEKTGIEKAALTGGVFQNRLLMEQTLKLLRMSGFEPFYNISVSPNDGGIALGQAYAAIKRSEK